MIPSWSCLVQVKAWLYECTTKMRCGWPAAAAPAGADVGESQAAATTRVTRSDANAKATRGMECRSTMTTAFNNLHRHW